jgi:hypothetical protein
MLLENLQIADPTMVYNTLDPTNPSPDVSVGRMLPNNFIKLGLYIPIDGKGDEFDAARDRKPQQNQKGSDSRNWRGDSNAEEKQKGSANIYFKFIMSCDKSPKEIMQSTFQEWKRGNGIQLRIKNIPSVSTMTPVLLYFLHNNNKDGSLLYELKNLLGRTQELMIDDYTLDEEDWDRAIPPMAIRRNVPFIPRQDKRQFNGWPSQLKMARKAIHIEVATEEAEFIKTLCKEAKVRGLFTPIWGKRVFATEPLGWESLDGDMIRMGRISQKHINYHASMIVDKLAGVNDLNAKADIKDARDPTKTVCTMTLRDCLYNFWKMENGSSLFGEIHQAGPMGNVEVVIPNTKEAEDMLVMMNKHFACYFVNYLKDLKVDEDFIQTIAGRGLELTLLHEVNDCKWDSEKKELLTPEDIAGGEEDELEEETWYVDHVAKFMENNKQANKKKQYAAPEALFNLDDEHSCKTINQKNDKEYEWVDGEDVLQLGRNKEEENAMDLTEDDGNDEVSAKTIEKDSPSKPAQRKSGLSSTAIDIDEASTNGGTEGGFQTLPLTSTASDAGQSASGPADGE